MLERSQVCAVNTLGREVHQNRAISGAMQQGLDRLSERMVHYQRNCVQPIFGAFPK